MDAMTRNKTVSDLVALNIGAAYEEVFFNLQLADVVSKMTNDQIADLLARAKKINASFPEDATREDIVAIRNSFLQLFPRVRPGIPVPR